MEAPMYDVEEEPPVEEGVDFRGDPVVEFEVDHLWSHQWQAEGYSSEEAFVEDYTPTRER